MAIVWYLVGLAFRRFTLYHYMTFSVPLFSSWAAFLIESLVIYIFGGHLHTWKDYLILHMMGDRSEIYSKDEPCGHPLVCSFHSLCRSFSFTRFLLSSRKDRIRFKDVFEKPCAWSFWIIKAGCCDTNALLISVDNTVTHSLLSAAIFQSSINLISKALLGKHDMIVCGVDKLFCYFYLNFHSPKP